MSPETDGSRLCLECGICCQGVLHGSAKVRADEVPIVRRLGLPLVETDAGPTFTLPCPRHQDNRCTVYAERPSPCTEYKCKLLTRYLKGEIPWAESLLRVRQARELVASLRLRLGSEGCSTGLWQLLQAVGEERLAATLDNREILLDFASLLVLSRAHFQNRAQPVEVLGA